MFRHVRLALIGTLLTALAAVVSAQPGPPASFPPLDPAGCVQKAQRILIIDMKSGWWSGDGGDFHTELLSRMIKDCPLVEVEYVFLQFIDPASGLPGFSGVLGFLDHYPARPGTTNGGFLNLDAFPSRPWAEYQQVWLLSGGDHDPVDVPTTNAFFTDKIVGAMAAPVAPGQPVPGLFIGGGLGHRDHANGLLAAIQLPEAFQTHVTELVVPSAAAGDIKVLSRVRRGGELSATHPLFEGLETLADRLTVEGTEVNSDFLLAASDPFQVVGRNTQGEPAIAVRETEARRVLIDAGVSRTYAAHLPEDTQTYRYLHNIIKYLAR